MDIFVNENLNKQHGNSEEYNEMTANSFSSFIAVTAFCGCIGGALYMVDITPRQELLSDEQSPLDLSFYQLVDNFNDAFANCILLKKVYAILLNGGSVCYRKKLFFLQFSYFSLF